MSPECQLNRPPGAHEGEEPQGAAEARQAHLQAHSHRLFIPGVPEVAPEQELAAQELPHRPPSLLATGLRLQVSPECTK